MLPSLFCCCRHRLRADAGMAIRRLCQARRQRVELTEFIVVMHAADRAKALIRNN
jgi:hypothetical protein